MKARVPWKIVLLILLPLWACGEWGGGLPEHILVQVNEETITADEFNWEFNEVMSAPNHEGKGVHLAALKQAYLDQVIERKILVQEARRLGIKVSTQELNDALLDIRKDYPEEGLDRRLDLTGTTLGEWKHRLEEKLLAEKMIHTALRSRGKIDDRQVFQYYEEHRSSFQIKEQVRVRHIIVTDGEEAIQLLKRLRKGEKFEKLAKEKSVGPEKVNGGDLGTFGRGERPPEFDPVFSMEVGTISEVIKSPYGYHIFKVEEKIEARQIPFEEAKTEVYHQLEQRRGEEEYKRWLKELRAKTTVKINQKLLRS